MKPAPQRRSLPPHIDVQTQSQLWEAQPLATKTVRDAITATASTLATAAGEVSVLLTDDSTIAKLNREWRGIDEPTNVLSFPASGKNAREDVRLFGDIVLAYETLERECDDENRTFLHHLAHLSVHGFLHLIGYDHQNDSQAEEMEGIESKVMVRLNMPDPYLSREVGND